jgi:hypothetical protein
MSPVPARSAGVMPLDAPPVTNRAIEREVSGIDIRMAETLAMSPAGQQVVGAIEPTEAVASSGSAGDERTGVTPPRIEEETQLSETVAEHLREESVEVVVARALDRVAQRLRDGHLVIAAEPAPSTDEAALAVVLATLLRGAAR